MIADAMVDTNVLVYAASQLADDREKSLIAMRLLQREKIGLSAQVIQEFVVVTTRKVRKSWSLDDALDWVETFQGFPCLPIDVGLVRYGAELSIRYQLSYWDGAIIAAAHRLNASILYTEDLNHGQTYGSVKAINPFRPA